MGDAQNELQDRRPSAEEIGRNGIMDCGGIRLLRGSQALQTPDPVVWLAAIGMPP